MGTLRPPGPVKPIVAMLAATPELLEEARAAVAEALGAVDLASEPTDWAHSGYYRAEMGEGIRRQFLALERLTEAGALPCWKLRTNAMEERWRTGRGRQVNLDPGYLDLNKLVLASTKDASHRIYLADGIYAEATLRYVGRSFTSWPSTYRDYAAPDAIAFFNLVRRRFRGQRRNRS